MILIKPWHEAQIEAYSIRKAVFIEEQGVPPEMELDESDPCAHHILVYANSIVVGTVRLLELGEGDRQIGQIGRMAVLASHRKQGFGSRLLKAVIELGVSRGLSQFELHAQLSAISFYERLGFVARGDIYHEAGIQHRDMMLKIQTPFEYP